MEPHNFKEKRDERRQLKQKLFAIRRFIEGEEVEMTPELEALKEHYESLTTFTSWSDFPELWDIGDPFGVKASFINVDDPAFSPIEKENYQALQDKTYNDIVFLQRQPGLNVGEGKELFQAEEEEAEVLTDTNE